MDDLAAGQVSRAGYCRMIVRNGAVPENPCVAFLLDLAAALADDGAGDSAAMRQVGICGIDDRIHPRLRQVTAEQEHVGAAVEGMSRSLSHHMFHSTSCVPARYARRRTARSRT